MASLYFLHEVVEHYYEFDALLDYFEIVVIPLANPGKHLMDWFSKFLEDRTFRIRDTRNFDF